MPAPATADEFLDIVQKSGVADEARLKAYLGKLTENSGVPTDPSKLAGILVRDGLLTYFQADQLLQGKWKRFFIGKYKVLERLGVGGMGQVFLCEHKLMRRRVAVKVLPAAKAKDPSSLERFYREARAVAALDHPNIVRAYDIDQDDNLHFLVMEFVDGTNLQDLVKKVGPLDIIRACHYVFGSAVGLQHAHEMGLVHRDIKPGNILVDRAGVVKILDMGLARFFNPDEDDLLTKKYDENILGTADYLAPEQAIDSHTVDIRADIYSLGGTFYYLLTGQPPFPEGTVAQKLLWHQTREPAAIRSLRPEVPPDVAEIVAKMMVKDVTKRYQTPADLMAALSPYLQTPIAPPSDKEMPQLSPAAMSAQTNPMATSRVISGSPTMSVGPNTVSHLSTSGTSHPSMGTQSDVLRTAASVPRHPVLTPPPAGTPGPAHVATPAPAAAAAPAHVWEDLGFETQADSRADTDRPKNARPSAKVKKPVDTSESTPTKGRRWIIPAAIAAGLGIFALGGLGVYLAIGPKSGGTTTNQPVAHGQARIWYVSRGTTPDPEHTLTTLRGAWEQVSKDDTILLMDDRIDDPPTVLDDSRGTKKGVKIEAGNASKQVIWTPKVSVGRPIAALQLVATENLRLAGLVIESQGSTANGIAIASSCPGLTLEQITVKQPQASGFRLQNVIGDTSRPVKISHCRVTAQEKIDAGVLFIGGSRYITVQSSRFEGPGLAAIKVGDGKSDAVVQDVEIRNNRISTFDFGVSLTGKLPNPETPVSLTITNNTFYAIGIAGVYTDYLLGTPKQLITMSRNYFSNSGELVSTAAANLPGLKATDNARDKVSREGAKVLIAAIPLEDYTLPPPNPTSDAEFLHSGGRLASIGPNKVPVGAQPE